MEYENHGIDLTLGALEKNSCGSYHYVRPLSEATSTIQHCKSNYFALQNLEVNEEKLSTGCLGFKPMP